MDNHRLEIGAVSSSMNRGIDKRVFNAQKFHLDDPRDHALYIEVMRKYIEYLLGPPDRYFNKDSELYVYVEWWGEEDFHTEFVAAPKLGEAAEDTKTGTKDASSSKNLAALGAVLKEKAGKLRGGSDE